MTHKERVRIAMRRGMPDRVPVVPQICPPHAILRAGLPYKETIVDRLQNPQNYDLLEAECAAGYGVDGFRVWLGMEPRQIEWDGESAFEISPRTGERTGIVDFSGGGGVLRLPEKRRPITEQDIAAVPVVPAAQVADGYWLRPHKKVIERYGREFFIIGVPGQFTVETMSHVEGMEASLMDMVERPEIVKAWTARQLEASIQRAIAMARLGVDAFYIGETFGQFMSPEQFSDLCLPYFRRFTDALRPYGPLIYLHMCGRITHLLDLIPETGVDCLEPLDAVGGTPPDEVKRRLGGKLALMGGVSTLLLAGGSLDEVRDNCRKCIRDVAPGGGYIMAACDMLPTETDPEKVRIMLETARTEGAYNGR